MIAPMKFVSGGDLGARDDVAQRLAARLADPDLGQRPAELVRQRALELLDDLAERGVEAEAGADGDRQQVEGVRDLEQDHLLALLDPAAEPELGDGVAEQQPPTSRHQGAQDEAAGPGCPTTRTGRRTGSPPTIAPTALMPSQSATRRSARVAGQGEPLLGLLGERRARDAREPARQPADQRAQGPLEERLLELELLEVLGLHRAELGQAGLDRVDRRVRRPGRGRSAGSRRPRAAAMRIGMSDGHRLDLDVDDLADEHEADEHHEPAEEQDDDAGRQAEEPPAACRTSAA